MGSGELLGCGVSLETATRSPAIVPALLTTRIRQISCGAFFVIALSDGKVFLGTQ